VDRRPTIHRRTLEEMIAGYTMITGRYGAPAQARVKLDGAAEYLVKCFPGSMPAVFADMETLTVTVEVTNCTGDRMTFVEPAAGFPSDLLITQLMLVTK
jgi:hypothetical protein